MFPVHLVPTPAKFARQSPYPYADRLKTVAVGLGDGSVDFVAVAENKGLIDKLGDVAFEKICKFISENKDTAKEYLDKYSDDKNISDYIKKSYRQDIISGGSGYFDQVVKNLKDIKNYPDRKAKYEAEKKEITDKLTDYENKLNAIDLKDRRKTKYLNDIKSIKENLEGAYRNFDVPLCPANIDTYEDRIKAVKDFELSKIYRLADKYLRENEYLNYKVSEQDLKSSEQKQKERESRVDSMFERADKKKEEGAERYERGAKVFDFEHGGIPLGQPNINGRLDSTLKRAYRDMDKGYEKYKEGEALESRAKGAEKRHRGPGELAFYGKRGLQLVYQQLRSGRLGRVGSRRPCRGGLLYGSPQFPAEKSLS